MKKNDFNDENSSFDYMPRSRKKKTNSKKKKVITVCAVTAGSILAICAIALGAGMTMVNSDTIADGVYSANINLSNLTVEEAIETLENSSISSYDLYLISGDKSYSFDVNEVEYTLDLESTAEKAYSYGKSGSIFTKILDALKAKQNKIDILPAFIFDSTQISEKLDEFGTDVCGALKEHEISISDDVISITPGASGYNGDPTDALSELNEALSEQLENSTEIHFDTKTPEEMTVEKLSSLITSGGFDATFRIENGEVVITEGQSGYTFDESEAQAALTELKEGGSVITIAAQAVKPKYTAAQLKQKLFNSELASYSTRYNAGQVNRSKNVAVAAGKLNNVILLPGETFSFNSTVGKRTAANGFMPAPEYQNGQSVMGIGGGTCQVSTTLYSAVLYANLEIVSRRNHSMSVSYVPLGQDATVTDGGTDFKFKNNTEFPIKIKTSAEKGTITVKIIGTAAEPPVTVKIVNTKTSDLSATTTRIVYDASGNEISRKVVANSKYKPHQSASSSSSQASSAPAQSAPSQATPVPEENVASSTETNTSAKGDASQSTPHPIKTLTPSTPAPTPEHNTAPEPAPTQEPTQQTPTQPEPQPEQNQAVQEKTES